LIDGVTEVLQIGSATAAKCSRSNGFLKVGELADGSAINLPVIVLNGADPGPVVWINALEDGNEYPGCLATLELATELTGKLPQLKGAIVLMPAVNLTAFRGNQAGGGTRYATADIEVASSFFRAYPGNPHGSFTAQAANLIWRYISQFANYFITFHGSGEMYGVDRVQVLEGSDKKTAKEVRHLAESFGIDVIMKGEIKRSDSSRPKGVLQRLIESGIPAVAVESNGGYRGVGLGWDATSLVRGSLNAFKHLGVLPGKPRTWNNYRYFNYTSGLGAVYSHHGGFFRSHIEVLDSVAKGQPIGEIRDFFGEVVEVIKSPMDGSLLGYWAKSPHIGSGQYRVFDIASPL
jgi:predicted deacylase